MESVKIRLESQYLERLLIRVESVNNRVESVIIRVESVIKGRNQSRKHIKVRVKVF